MRTPGPPPNWRPRPSSSHRAPGSAPSVPGNVSIYAFRRGLSCICPPRRAGATTPIPAPTISARILNAIKEAPTRFHSRVKGISGRGFGSTTTNANICCGGGRQECEADGLSISVGAVEFANGSAGVTGGGVCYKSGAGGAASAVEAEGEGRDRTNTGEEVLYVVLIGVIGILLERGVVLQGRLLLGRNGDFRREVYRLERFCETC